MTIEWDQCEINDRSLELDNPDEEIGTKLKRWIQVDGDDRPWLVKDARTDKRDMTVSGEDWAEWLAMILARQLAIPCAEIKPVRYLGNRAIASRQVFPPGQGALAHGNELLSRANPNYDRHLRSEHPGYTLESVRSVLLQVQPPPEFTHNSAFNAFDLWAGYLVLDMLMQGTDRHHQNWAAVSSDQATYLAPTFDHGNSFGFQLRDPERERRLNSQEHLEKWIQRGKAQAFAGQPSLINLALGALAMTNTKTRTFWLERVDELSLNDFGTSVASIPSTVMSEPAGRFAYKLLEINRGRFLSEYATRFKS